MKAVNGIVFDLEKVTPWFIDFAKSNSRSKRPRTGFGSLHISATSNSAYNTIGYPPAQSSGNADAYAETPAMKSSATPCPTLFVANLGASCTEEELIQVFSRCPGFLKSTMQSTYGGPVAFVDFQDTGCSTAAMNSLQGSIPYSSPAGGGIRLEYIL